MEKNRNDINFYCWHIIIFILLIPYYFIGQFFLWVAALLSPWNSIHYLIPNMYMQSILFNIPVWFYIYWSVKSFRSRHYITGSIFSLALISLLYGCYFTGVDDANKVINETYQVYKKPPSVYEIPHEKDDEKIGIAEAYELYFAPWMIEKRVNRRIENWYHNPVRELTEQEEIEVKRKNDEAQKRYEYSLKHQDEIDEQMRNYRGPGGLSE